MGSLADLAAELFAVSRDVPLAEQEAIERGAAILERAMRANVGSTRFTPLAESTVRRKGHSLQLLETGELKGSISSTIGHREAWIGSTSPKAIFHEWGTSRIPPRPFVRTAMNDNMDRIGRMATGLVAKAMHGHGPFGELIHEAIHAVKEAAHEVKETWDHANEPDQRAP